MFSVRQKRGIADAVQQILRETDHPELPKGEIQFILEVRGAEAWSFARIENNGAVAVPAVNPWNERQDPLTSAPHPYDRRGDMSQTELHHTLESIRTNLDVVSIKVADILRQASEGKSIDDWGIFEAAKHTRQLEVDLNYLGLLRWKVRREQDPTAKHPTTGDE